MSWQATAWASRIEDDRLSVGERFLLFSLCNYADEEWSCFPGVDTLARLTGQSTRTVIRQAARLEEFGYVRRERRFTKDGKRTSDRWFIQQPETVTVQSAEAPPNDQVTDCHVVPPNDQVTDCHVINEPPPGDSCVTYIEEGIPVENPRGGQRPPTPTRQSASTTTTPTAGVRAFPEQCDAHQSGPNGAPCRGCGKAREAFTADKQRVVRAASEAASIEARQRAAVIAAAIRRCRMCDESGYIDGQACSHDPRQADRARRQVKNIRALLNQAKEPTMTG